MSRGDMKAQHLIDETFRQQLTDPAQPDEARRCEVVVGQAVLCVGFGELVHSISHPPAKVQIREGRGQLGEVDAVVAQIGSGVFGEHTVEPGTASRTRSAMSLT